MNVLVCGITSFSLAFFLHFVIWKFCPPAKNQIITLLKIFLAVFTVSIFIFKKFSSIILFGITPPQTFFNYLEFLFFYISLTMTYVTSYSAVEADSPSLIMVLSINKAAPAGLTKEKLYAQMTDEILLKPRIKDLVYDKMIYRENGKYKLTFRGVFWVTIFIFFRKLLNASKGG